MIVVSYTTTTDSTGSYVVNRLLGNKYYILSASLLGKKTAIVRNVAIAPSGGITYQNIYMQDRCPSDSVIEHAMHTQIERGGRCAHC